MGMIIYRIALIGFSDPKPWVYIENLVDVRYCLAVRLVEELRQMQMGERLHGAFRHWFV